MNLRNQLVEKEKQIDAYKDWNKEKHRYNLVSLGPGSQAFLYQPAEDDDTPRHYLCANCFYLDKRSILQKTGYSNDAAIYKCFTCGAEVKDFLDKPPSITYQSIKREKPFSDY